MYVYKIYYTVKVLKGFCISMCYFYIFKYNHENLCYESYSFTIQDYISN